MIHLVYAHEAVVASAGAATVTLNTRGGTAQASALHSMLKTAAVELPDVAWDCSSTDAQAVPLAIGALHADQPAPDVMGRHAEGGAWLSPVLYEEAATGAQQSTEDFSGALTRRLSTCHSTFTAMARADDFVVNPTCQLMN